MMNPEAKAKVLEALRSGKYKQGSCRLKSEDNCYCVWGVICDVSGLHPWVIDKARGATYNGDASSPPRDVCEWAGIGGSSFVTIEGARRRASLMFHNDCGANFEQLANAIEEQL